MTASARGLTKRQLQLRKASAGRKLLAAYLAHRRCTERMLDLDLQKRHRGQEYRDLELDEIGLRAEMHDAMDEYWHLHRALERSL